MNLLDFIFFMFCGAWLIGFACAGMIVYKVKSKEKEVDNGEPLNLDSEPMNARKLNQKEGRENDE